MPFVDTLKDFIIPAPFRQHPSVMKTGAELNKAVQDTDVTPLSPSDVPGMFDVMPMSMLMGQSVKRDYYSQARHSYKAYKSDPRLQDALGVAFDKAIEKNDNELPFDISLAPEFQDELWERINEMADRTQLYAMQYDALKWAWCEGESYWRVLFNTKGNDVLIHGFERVPGAAQGFEMRGPSEDGSYYLIEVDTRRVVSQFSGFEIIPFKRNAREREIGEPVLGSTMVLYDHLCKMQNVLPMQRQYRSGVSRIYQYEGMTQQQFKDLLAVEKDLQKSASNKNPFSDIRTMAKVNTANETSASLWNITDIEFMLSACLAAIGTPIYLLSTMTDKVPNFAVADVINDNWIKGRIGAMESSLTGHLPTMRWLGENALDGMGTLKAFGIQLYLWGYNPRETGIKLQWPNKLRLTEQEAQANNDMYDRGVISNTGYAHRMGNVDYETELEQKARDKELHDELLGAAREVVNSNNDDEENETEVEELVSIAKNIIKYSEENGIALNGR